VKEARDIRHNIVDRRTGGAVGRNIIEAALAWHQPN
jgi:hypothetical protein